jgi:hypothetical protein
MDNQNKTNCYSKDCSIIFLGILMALGLTMLGYMVGHNFLEAKKLDRVVSVKGLTERVVDSDLVIWPITVKGIGNDLQTINTKIEQDRDKVINYLIKQGFGKEEIELGKYNVTDLLAREYRNKEDESNRYIINATIELTSNKVMLVKKIYQQIPDLVKEGIIIEVGDTYSYKGPRYEYTKFNDLKLEMLQEASKNAKKAAEQFAIDSGSKIGSIKKANQGIFVIEPLYSNEASGSDSDVRASIKKKIRAVASIDYYLID